MSTTPPLALSNLVSISVTVAPTAASANSFNQGLFVGSSTVIPSYGANSRLRQYSFPLTGMLTDGFTTASPEYIAAQIIFSQTPPPQFVWIGRQDLTALSSSAGSITIAVAGTGWAVGDQFTITQGGASHGTGKIVAEGGGIPSSIAVVEFFQGTGYATASALPTVAVSPSTGTGLTVNIISVGETLLEAATQCRTASGVWYGLSVYNPADGDNLALSEWADAGWQTTRYYPWSADAAIPAGTTNNLALQLQALNLRVLGIYATTQSGLYPNNIYAAAALMGSEMGLNTGLANSFFTMAHKQLAGIAPEPLTQTQYNNIKSAGFNAYGNFSPYSFFEPGFLSNGTPSFLWLYLAVLVANLQLNELAVLADNPAVPQTNAGEQLLIGAANAGCNLLATIGFLAGAIWEGASFSVVGVNIQNGQAVPLGYICVAQPYSQQSIQDRDAGKAMPIYIFITTAGAVQSLVIGVYTQL